MNRIPKGKPWIIILIVFVSGTFAMILSMVIPAGTGSATAKLCYRSFNGSLDGLPNFVLKKTEHLCVMVGNIIFWGSIFYRLLTGVRRVRKKDQRTVSRAETAIHLPALFLLSLVFVPGALGGVCGASYYWFARCSSAQDPGAQFIVALQGCTLAVQTIIMAVVFFFVCIKPPVSRTFARSLVSRRKAAKPISANSRQPHSATSSGQPEADA